MPGAGGQRLGEAEGKEKERLQSGTLRSSPMGLGSLGVDRDSLFSVDLCDSHVDSHPARASRRELSCCTLTTC